MSRIEQEPRPKPGTPESWDECVRVVIGPRMPGESKDEKQRQALELAAAALRYAGKSALAANPLDLSNPKPDAKHC